MGVFGCALTIGMSVGLAGCKSNQAAQVVDANHGPDPAAVNNAPVDSNAQAPATGTTRVLSSRASAPSYSQGEQTGGYASQDDAQYESEQEPAAEYAPQPPPPLPDYQQPELTEQGYLWTPGYWAYGSGGYYWVPGAWVAPPYQGALWTPGYWANDGGRYGFHRGYWARHIGFYGGINYGFGYVGSGYEGGYWNKNQFEYNNRVNRVNLTDVHTVYQRNVTVIHNTRISYNGPQGVQAHPRPAEVAVLREQRTPPMQVQQQRVQQAQQNKAQFYAENHGKPALVVAPERVPADRTPPEPIRPNPGTAQPQRGGFGQPAAGQNAQQQEQQRANQARQDQLQQSQRSQEAERQQQQQRQEPQRPGTPTPRPEQRAPQPQPRPAAPVVRPEQQARPAPEQRSAPAPRPAQEQRPAPAPRPEAAPRPAPAQHPVPENRPEKPPVVRR